MMRQRFLLASILCLTAAISKAQDELPANPITPGIDLNMPTILVGDANNDGKVNTDDAVTISSHILGRETPGFFEEAADVNADGRIDIQDVAIIIAYLVAKKD